jgi:small subunit ribosomal protein S17
MEKTTEKHTRAFTGLVTSTGMQKTITVKIDTMKMHQKYQKAYRVSKKYHVHDEKAAAKVGDMVTFKECRPLSKTKRWTLVEVLKK